MWILRWRDSSMLDPMGKPALIGVEDATHLSVDWWT